jgi:hypothetical protein
MILDDSVVGKRVRGRPTLDKTRKNTHTVRFDEEEEAMIRHIEIETGVNISDIIRKAVRMFYNFKFGRL